MHLEAEQDVMWVEGIHSGRHMWLYDTDVFNRWDVLEIAIIEKGGKNNKVGWKPEKLCHTFWWREQNPGGDKSGKAWCPGTSQVQGWRPCESWPPHGEEEGTASETKGVQGSGEQRNLICLWTESAFEGLGKGLPLKDAISPSGFCRAGTDQLMKQWILLEKLGLWSWTLSKMLTSPSGYWHLSTGMEATADIP